MEGNEGRTDFRTRQATAMGLTEAGYPISAMTLATMATRGGGPEFVKFGPRVLYDWNVALAWARGRLSKPVRSTSELGAVA